VQRFSRALASCRPIKSEAGVTAIEYGLITALIAVAILIVITVIGTNITSMLNVIANTL
jgi:pilus assembly protein Flp/PilA